VIWVFLLLGIFLERVGRNSLRDLFFQEVVTPLGLSGVDYGPVPAKEAAATEVCQWRNRLVQGEVFDENAAVLPFSCGHAGVFAKAIELSRWCRAWLEAYHGRSSWLPASVAKLITTRVKTLPPSTWAFGWDTRSEQGSSAGDRFFREELWWAGFSRV